MLEFRKKRPKSKILCSTVARKLEKEFPNLNAQEIHKRAGEKLKEEIQKFVEEGEMDGTDFIK